MRRLLIVALILLPGAVAAVDEAGYEKLNRSLTDGVVLPTVEGFATATDDLAQRIAGLCEAPSEAALAEVVEGFDAVMDTWQALQPLAFGPIMEGEGPARFQFWPDDRGIGARQLRRVLSSGDESVLDPASLAGKSVALGDLQALEALLFDENADIGRDGFRCAYALSIARLMAGRAAALAAAWRAPDGYALMLRTAALGNDAFYDAAEAARVLLCALTHGPQWIVERKLRPALGRTADSARPRAAESWRSGRSIPNLLANLATLRALLATPGGFADLAAESGDPLIGRTLVSMLDEARDRLAAVGVPLDRAVQQPAGRAEIEKVVDLLDRFRQLVEHGLVPGIGLTVGFNASDGD